MKKILIILLLSLPAMIWAQESMRDKITTAFKNKEYEKAKKLLLESKSNPNDSELEESFIYTGLLHVYEKLEDKDNYTKTLDDAFNKFPGNLYVLFSRFTNMNFYEGFAFIDSLLIKHPEHKATCLYLKGRLFLNRGMIEEAEPYHTESIELDDSRNDIITEYAYFSTQYALSLLEDIHKRRHLTAAEKEIKANVIRILNKSARYYRMVYDTSTEKERFDNITTVELSKVCKILIALGASADEYIKEIDIYAINGFDAFHFDY